jgi:subtilisin family serine protease
MIKKIPVLLIALSSTGITLAQKADTTAATTQMWYQADRAKSGLHGISINEAYGFLKNRKLKSRPVVVAVIDSGIDTLHEDLKPVLWVNPREIPGNGIDDDQNGRVDDINGWNFIGGKDGRNIKQNSSEETRVYHGLKSKYEGRDENRIDAIDMAEFKMWKKARSVIFAGEDEAMDTLLLRRLVISATQADSVLQKGLNKTIYSGEELGNWLPVKDNDRKAKNFIYGMMKDNNALKTNNNDFIEGLSNFVNKEVEKQVARKNPPRDWRAEIVQDDPDNLDDRNYGNNDVMASTPDHGTHCSGIIAAARDNGKGIDGIADNVKIMMLRAVPDGDEHDKDIALAIRYAADNGAQIINMSFGKDFSPRKNWVDDAVRYAESKGVLFVHAAGNDAKNIDKEDNFPDPRFADGKGRAKNWITVGASGDPKLEGLIGDFSNYGKKEVDVFAPGVDIYSTVPGGNVYANHSGTSMAGPVVTGIAALLMEYFPTLTAAQVKYVIEKSVVPVKTKVTKPGSEEKVMASDISVTGGIVNAFEAVKLAATLSTQRPVKVPTPKVNLQKKPKG